MKPVTRATGRLISGVAAALVVTVGLALAPDPAAASPLAQTCGGYNHINNCGSAQICYCCSSSNDCSNTSHGEDHGNCVWWAWEMACQHWGEALSTCHNADTWNEYNQATHHISTEPCVGTIFVCEQNTTQCGAGNWGHVGWVLNVNLNGSIDVSEQGCCWFYGDRTRPFDAQLAVPTMDYIYQQGVSSCSQCDCDPGETDLRPCTEGCGTEERTCESDCTWGNWSGCGPGECEPGESQSCGQCGLQICLLDCTWSACNGTCDPDAGTTTPDGGGIEPDGGGSEGPVNGGCSCQSGGASSGAGLGLLILLALGWWRQRRRRVVSHPVVGDTAGLSEHPGLAVINFVCLSP